ncbi:MAG: hypothetical protein CFE24_02465 [Flavobacterium sp. BFFFF2]|nr:MAG: hypothetical protein CFE24_02465 [Flavobacterium sp. BFFFF2]
MQKLMRKAFLMLTIFFGSTAFYGQTTPTADLNDLINDAVYFTDRYITPMTDAAVYQASSNWMVSTKLRKLGQVTGGVYFNTFFVPNRDRTFNLSNTEMRNLQIKDAGLTPMVMQSALGSDQQTTLEGRIDLGIDFGGVQAFTLDTPQGVGQETITYPYAMASVGLWKGFEVSGKFSAHVQLVHGDYQVWGAGLKHNLGQYFKTTNPKNRLDSAVMFSYCNEVVSFDLFKSTNSLAQSLLSGIERLQGVVSTYQLQWNFSKNWNKFEFMGGIIGNYSDFEYKVMGSDNSMITTTDGETLNTKLNNRFKTIAKSKYNLIGEVSCRYHIYKYLYAQSAFAFGKFTNLTAAVQVEF